jgi:hypothetical protein
VLSYGIFLVQWRIGNKRITTLRYIYIHIEID